MRVRVVFKADSAIDAVRRAVDAINPFAYFKILQREVEGVVGKLFPSPHRALPRNPVNLTARAVGDGKFEVEAVVADRIDEEAVSTAFEYSEEINGSFKGVTDG